MSYRTCVESPDPSRYVQFRDRCEEVVDQLASRFEFIADHLDVGPLDAMMCLQEARVLKSELLDMENTVDPTALRRIRDRCLFLIQQLRVAGLNGSFDELFQSYVSLVTYTASHRSLSPTCDTARQDIHCTLSSRLGQSSVATDKPRTPGFKPPVIFSTVTHTPGSLKYSVLGAFSPARPYAASVAPSIASDIHNLDSESTRTPALSTSHSNPFSPGQRAAMAAANCTRTGLARSQCVSSPVACSDQFQRPQFLSPHEPSVPVSKTLSDQVNSAGSAAGAPEESPAAISSHTPENPKVVTPFDSIQHLTVDDAPARSHIAELSDQRDALVRSPVSQGEYEDLHGKLKEEMLSSILSDNRVMDTLDKLVEDISE